jgi:hypothetical protein
MKKRYALIATAVLCAVAVGPGGASRGKSSTPFPFTTVTPQQLASNGVTLDTAQAAPPGNAVS